MRLGKGGHAVAFIMIRCNTTGLGCEVYLAQSDRCIKSHLAYVVEKSSCLSKRRKEFLGLLSVMQVEC